MTEKTALTEDYKRMIDTLHIVLCTDDECGYDAEESIEGCWEQPAHVEWIGIVSALLYKFNLSPEDFPKLIADYQNILTTINASPSPELLISLIDKPSVLLHKLRAIKSKSNPLLL